MEGQHGPSIYLVTHIFIFLCPSTATVTIKDVSLLLHINSKSRKCELESDSVFTLLSLVTTHWADISLPDHPDMHVCNVILWNKPKPLFKIRVHVLLSARLLALNFVNTLLFV